MRFLIAGTFSDSLGHLQPDEQKAVKITAFDLQRDPANPGLKLHRLDHAKDENFWSVRVNRDLRLIVHRTKSSFLLCYVDHHDDAYRWAEVRKLEKHPKTGAAQFVEVVEKVREIEIPQYVVGEPEPPPPPPPLFASRTEDELLTYGVPQIWIGEVREATEDTLFDVVDHLPEEAAEALLELATGSTPEIAAAQPTVETPFEHPDAQRRFRMVADKEELERALDYPWEKWTVFLHPTQREWVEKDYSGPARISGSAGTGKTVVALHRAVYLARNHPESRILLTTFSDSLAESLRTKIRRLIGNEPRILERIEVHSILDVGQRLYRARKGPFRLATNDQLTDLLREAAEQIPDHGFSHRFLETEWHQVVDAWQLLTWDDYRNVARLGRKTRLPESRRETLWKIYDHLRSSLSASNLITEPQLFTELAADLANDNHPPFDYAIVDESQDVSVAQLRFFAALGADRPNALFFAGDLGQRIFQQPFSWKSLGIEIRGRSHTLRVNYRTSHQIRQQADRLLAPKVRDVDGNVEDRSHTVSVFNGPPPTVLELENEEDECAAVATWLQERIADGIKPREIGLFVRSNREIDRAYAALERAGLPYRVLDQRVEFHHGYVSVSTMHLAKGLEFRVVVVMACDDEVIPSEERIASIGDEADLREVYDTERQLLYVACTRPRDHLLLTCRAPGCDFLGDL